MKTLILCSIDISRRNGITTIFDYVVNQKRNKTTFLIYNGFDGSLRTLEGTLIKKNPIKRIKFWEVFFNFLPHYLIGSYVFNKQIINDYSEIVVIGAQSTHWLMGYKKNISQKITYYQVDSHFNYYKKKVNFFNNLYKYLYLNRSIISYEAKIYKNCSDIIFVSKQDILQQEKIHPEYNFIYNKLPLEKSNYFIKIKNNLNELKVVFFGDFGYKPNKEAADFIIKLARSPKVHYCKFYLVGARLNTKKLNFPKNVVYTDYVEDLNSLILDMDVFISPIFSGAGTKNKVLKALSMGMPSILSAESLSGLECENNDFYYSANTQHEFEDMLCSIKPYENRYLLSKNAINFISKY